MITATVRFDDQTRVAPKEIGHEPPTTHVERDVDLGSRDTIPVAHGEKQALQITARPLGLGVELVEDQAESGDSTAAAMASQQRAQGDQVDDPQNLGLCEGLPQLPYRYHRGQIKKSALYGGARDPAHRRPISGLEGTVSVRVDSGWTTPTPIRRRHVDRVSAVLPNTPQRPSRSVRQHSVGPTPEHSSHPPPLWREQRMPHRVHALTHSMQPSYPGSLTHAVLGEAQSAQLVECHQTVLPSRNPSNVQVPPAGLKAIHILAFSPVGGRGLGWHALHAVRMRGRGARVVRRTCHDEGENVTWRMRRRPQRERPGGCRASRPKSLAC